MNFLECVLIAVINVAVFCVVGLWLFRFYLCVFVVNLSSYARMGFAKRFRNPILLVSWIRLSSSGLSMILAKRIRMKYMNRYVKPLGMTLGTVERRKKCAFDCAYNSF